MVKMTDRTRELLKFLKKFIRVNGYAPVLREIVEGTSYSSTSSARYGTQMLEELGHLELIPNVVRGIRLVPEKVPGDRKRHWKQGRAPSGATKETVAFKITGLEKEMINEASRVGSWEAPSDLLREAALAFAGAILEGQPLEEERITNA